MEGQSDFWLLRLEIPTVVSEGHPLSSSSLLGRDADGMEGMGHIFRVPPLAFPPSFIRDIGLVPTGLRDSVHSFLYPGPPPSALRTLGPRLTGHSIVKKGFLRAPWGKCGAIGHPEVITRIIIPDPWGTEQEVSHPGAVAEPFPREQPVGHTLRLGGEGHLESVFLLHLGCGLSCPGGESREEDHNSTAQPSV